MARTIRRANTPPSRSTVTVGKWCGDPAESIAAIAPSNISGMTVSNARSTGVEMMRPHSARHALYTVTIAGVTPVVRTGRSCPAATLAPRLRVSA